jgi:nucleoside phosphorylase
MGLRPGADVVVVTALGLEYDAVRARLGATRAHTDASGIRYEIGRLPGGTRVALALIGTGNLTAAALTGRTIETFAPSAILFVGVAGGLGGDVARGDVVVATRINAYHGGRDDSSGFRPRPRGWLLPHQIEHLARDLAKEWPERVHFAPLVSGEVVLDSRTSTVATLIAEHYGDAAAIDMESAGFAEAAHRADFHRAVVVRGISDTADGTKKSSDGEGWQPRAASNAAEFALALADRLRTVRPAKSRRALVISAALVVTAAVVALIAFIGLPMGDTPDGNPLVFELSTTAYHPRDGRLPSTPPPDTECGQWTDWANETGAAATTDRLLIRPAEGQHSPVTVTNVEVVLLGEAPVEKNVLLRCQDQPVGTAGPTLHVDLTAPLTPKSVDTDADQYAEATVPPGRFTIHPDESRWLAVQLDGKDGWVYTFELRFEIAGQGWTTFGSREKPIRTAFIDLDSGPYETYDWHRDERRWVPVS